MAKVLKVLSQFDIDKVLGDIGKTLKDFPCQEVEDALFSIGFDRKGLEVEHDILHRPMFSVNNEPWLGSRIIGFERQDREWLFSGRSTLENIIGSQKDSDHRRDLAMMSAQSNNTATIIEHIENKRDVNKKEVINESW